MVRKSWTRIVVLSAIVLVPCFWQHRIEAGDLRSHVYNAWLIQLIQRGQAPGLWLAPVRNNVLFDYLLSGLAGFFSLPQAARLATGIAVLVFFWGAFAFVRAIVGRSAWSQSPILAAIAYGWTFQEGFLNYYLSLGLAFTGLTVVLSRKPWRWVVFALLAPVVYLAHPIGLGWMLAAALYLTILRSFPGRFHGLLLVSATASIIVLRFLLQSHYRVEFPATSVLYNIAFYNGFDQLILTRRYVLPVLLLGLVFIAGMFGELRRKGGIRELSMLRPPEALHLYLLSLVIVFFLPNAIYFSQYPVPISALTTRLTSISSVLLCALFGAVRPRKWRLPLVNAAAAMFFVFLYQDSSVLNRMEDQIARLVNTLPAGQRVISTIGAPPAYRFSTKHLPDTSCIEHCFSYGNYEASSKQFRIRASVGNLFVVADIHQASLMEEGRYIVQPADLPLYQIYQCSVDWTQLCIRSLNTGERNDLHGVHPVTTDVPSQPR